MVSSGDGGWQAVLLQAAPLRGTLTPEKALKYGLFHSLSAGLLMQLNRLPATVTSEWSGGEGMGFD